MTPSIAHSSAVRRNGSDAKLGAALALHAHLSGNFVRDGGLIGPDPGIRFDYRLGRFIKSYFPGVFTWAKELYYLQGQGYWILANWRLFGATGERLYSDMAIACAKHAINRQRPDGGWDYPNPEWRGRTATAEGTWVSIGLLETFRRTGDRLFLQAATRWHRYLSETIGYQRSGDEWAVNYFANRGSARVPNNSAFVLRFLGELSPLTIHADLERTCRGLIAFLQANQQASGELPYVARGGDAGPGTPHFQCYQYNAFQCLDLMAYRRATGDDSVRPLIARLATFLESGVAPDGHALYACGNHHRRVTYHAAAVGAALAEAEAVGLVRDTQRSRRAFAYVLGLQQAGGGFPYSSGDYRCLSDRRQYPRYLAMILFHLLSSPE